METLMHPVAKIRNLLNPHANISIYWTNKLKASPQVRFNTCDAKFISVIVGLGCVPNKCEIIPFPDNNVMPQKYLWDFIRCYLDADGSLMLASNGVMKICSDAKCTPFLHQLNDSIVSEVGVTSTNIWDKKQLQLTELKWAKPDDLRQLLPLLHNIVAQCWRCG